MRDIIVEIRQKCKDMEFLAVRLDTYDSDLVRRAIIIEIEELQKLLNEVKTKVK